MKLYSSNKDYKLYQGNMLDMLDIIEKESIDSIVTDPPYELNFMSKGWDNAGVSFQPDTWKKCYEVLKPGGYLLAFGGSRTFHRIACAIEDAGFEIRDTIMWLYGSGFPKSLNISKTLEKREGIIEETTGTLFNNPGGKRDLSKRSDYGYIYEPQLYLAKQWQGWGTALKPSYESIIIAQKPYSIEIYLLIGILDILNEVIDKCQLNLNANIVEKISKLNQAKQSVEENIVLNNAESKMFTKEDLLEVMDMLQSTLTENTNLNTELLCLNFLVEICNQMSKYTTETKINLITELKILKLLVVENILKNTIEKNKTKQLGMKQNVLTVEEFLKEEKLKLNYINILSAQDNAILKEEESSLHPKLNQIIVARKPFKGSLVDNVIKNGVGGINIDECRVGNEERQNQQAGFIRRGRTDEEVFLGTDKNRPKGTLTVNGRFPANTILTYDETDFDEVCGGFPNTKTGNIKPYKRNMKNQICYGNLGKNVTSNHIGDSGSASRYFMNCKYTGKDENFRRYKYTPKASKKDRDEGLDLFEERKFVLGCNGSKLDNIEDKGFYGEDKSMGMNRIKLRKNTHPTVKPTNLMQYLVRLVTPNNGIILDPFNGSGSTGKAVMYENKERNKNYKYIGIELTEEYLPISKARIEYVCKLAEEEKNKERQMSIYDL